MSCGSPLNPAAASTHLKLKGLGLFWVTSLVTLVAGTLLFDMRMGSGRSWSTDAFTMLLHLGIIVTLTLLNAVGAGVALFALPDVAPNSAGRLKLTSAVLGSVAPGLVLLIQLAAANELDFYLFGHDFFLRLGIWLLGGPLLIATAFIATIRLLVRCRWLSLHTPGRCAGCGYIIFTRTTEPCPECGLSQAPHDVA